MAEVTPLVRHPTAGYPAGIADDDTLTAPSFRASNTTGVTIDANGGQVVNVANGSAASDAVNKGQLDTAIADRVPTSRTISTGEGLAGGGNLSANRTINLVLDGSSLVKSAAGLKANIGTEPGTVAAGDHSHGNLVPTSRRVVAGQGLTGGGSLSGDVTLNVAGGNGIEVSPDSVAAKLGGGLRFEEGATTIDLGTDPSSWGGHPELPSYIGEGLGLEEGTGRLYFRCGSGLRVTETGTVTLAAGLGIVSDWGTVDFDGEYPTFGVGEFSGRLRPKVLAVAPSIAAGEPIAAGEAVSFMPSTGLAHKATAVEEKGNFLGIALFDADQGDQVHFVTTGLIRLIIPSISTLSTGVYWLGAQPGKLYATPPDTDGARVVRVGFKTSDGFIVSMQDFGEV